MRAKNGPDPKRHAAARMSTTPIIRSRSRWGPRAGRTMPMLSTMRAPRWRLRPMASRRDRYRGVVSDSRMLLGIDLGTTSVKALLVSPSGEALGLGRCTHPTRRDGAIAEQDPTDWWAAVVTAVRRALADAWDDGRTELSGIAVSGQGPTTVALDAKGAHLAPAIIWLDTRATGLAGELSSHVGVPVWQLGSLPHERWLAMHEPA